VGSAPAAARNGLRVSSQVSPPPAAALATASAPAPAAVAGGRIAWLVRRPARGPPGARRRCGHTGSGRRSHRLHAGREHARSIRRCPAGDQTSVPARRGLAGGRQCTPRRRTHGTAGFQHGTRRHARRPRHNRTSCRCGYACPGVREHAGRRCLALGCRPWRPGRRWRRSGRGPHADTISATADCAGHAGDGIKSDAWPAADRGPSRGSRGRRAAGRGRRGERAVAAVGAQPCAGSGPHLAHCVGSRAELRAGRMGCGSGLSRRGTDRQEGGREALLTPLKAAQACGARSPRGRS